MSLRLFKEELFLFVCLLNFYRWKLQPVVVNVYLLLEQCRRWMEFKIARYGGNSVLEWIVCVAFSRRALVKLLLGSSFLDISLKSERYLTSNFNYFNTVIWTMVSYIVEALIFLQAPRSPYESTGGMCCIFLNVNCWLKTVLSCV